eukprot:CAMPEP_0185032736 /NCGR_PEP_ID=MMETSP1103-20130426/21063_1 /TAXON_ID=36769 /ORGANISM="Paraphysomonas bandaiensis, Strain Caron Lab Isolate" /LENGTH=255 /DNA_ID=CAMNT_0027568731 /DNA_START=258 /DNA_END=1028 /DNA_ORIENTATION=+
MTVEEKRQIHLSKSQHFRGWSSVNEEFTLGMPDFKETFDFGLDETATDTKGWKSLRGPNQWPSRNQVQFRSFLNQYIFEMCKVGRIIMNNAALILDRDPKELAPYFEHPFSIVRFIKYPPTREKQQGIGPHTDYGFLTMILQDDGVAGLEAQTRSGEWISVPPLKNTFAVNIGDALQAWSCDVFRATPHRVLNPECERSRYSIPFFFEPDLESKLSDAAGNPLALMHENKDPVYIYGEHLYRAYRRSYPDITSAT